VPPQSENFALRFRSQPKALRPEAVTKPKRIDLLVTAEHRGLVNQKCTDYDAALSRTPHSAERRTQQNAALSRNMKNQVKKGAAGLGGNLPPSGAFIGGMKIAPQST
jgi:hypothetical protein